MKEKSIFIILSQTGSFFSRALKVFTGDEFNHSSISLSPTLEPMYSFGRLHPNNPFPGGFVRESLNSGTFKRFNKTTAVVLEVKVSEEQYNGIKSFIDFTENNKTKYHYNYLGVLYAFFKKDYLPKNKFYCSQFVRSCLATFDIDNSNKLPNIIKPIDFLKLNNKRIIYSGLFKNYNYVV